MGDRTKLTYHRNQSCRIRQFGVYAAASAGFSLYSLSNICRRLISSKPSLYCRNGGPACQEIRAISRSIRKGGHLLNIMLVLTRVLRRCI